jgi:hypothetical protein
MLETFYAVSQIWGCFMLNVTMLSVIYAECRGTIESFSNADRQNWMDWRE